MKKAQNKILSGSITRFNRHFFDAAETFTRIGSGEIGGKASGLAYVRNALQEHYDPRKSPGIIVNIPTLTVIATDSFDQFMQNGNLRDIAASELRDDQIAAAFQKAELPGDLVGDLWALISRIHVPLAIRSSSLLEDALYEPFAGVYATKMIPNNQYDAEIRYRKLIEAIKYVYASTYFKKARNYIRMTGRAPEDEKMAVIIQEIVGLRRGDRFYPDISGVARSFNFYPVGHARPEDGVVNLALGLGKTIVDGGRCWSYSPAYPRANPPYNSPRGLLRQTQTSFWAVNMGKPSAYNPLCESEYLVQGELSDAEKDGTLRFAASTYRPEDDRIVVGIGSPGVRLINFAPIMAANLIPLNDLIKDIMAICQAAIGNPVEIEFAVTIDARLTHPVRVGLLQVRPMVVTESNVEISQEEMNDERNIIASENILGNGTVENIRDIIYVKPELFEAKATKAIADQIELLNQKLVDSRRNYLLIGFGRWGSSEPWLGIPIDWSQISNARVIVEANLPGLDIEPSQGSHFFHNLMNLRVCYFFVPHTGKYRINWEWLNRQEVVAETEYVRYVRAEKPLGIRVDGRNGRGIVSYERR
jgi:hypothetical protein